MHICTSHGRRPFKFEVLHKWHCSSTWWAIHLRICLEKWRCLPSCIKCCLRTTYKYNRLRAPVRGVLFFSYFGDEEADRQLVVTRYQLGDPIPGRPNPRIPHSSSSRFDIQQLRYSIFWGIPRWLTLSGGAANHRHPPRGRFIIIGRTLSLRLCMHTSTPIFFTVLHSILLLLLIFVLIFPFPNSPSSCGSFHPSLLSISQNLWALR